MTIPRSYIEIKGQKFNVESVTLPPSGKKFHDAWDIPVNGVISIDSPKKVEILTDLVKEECKKRICAVSSATA